MLFTTDDLRRALSDVERDAGLPLAVAVFDAQAVQGDGFDVGEQLVSGAVDRLAHQIGTRAQRLDLVFDADVGGAQQEALGVLQKNHILEQAQQQEVEGVRFDVDPPALGRDGRSSSSATMVAVVPSTAAAKSSASEPPEARKVTSLVTASSQNSNGIRQPLTLPIGVKRATRRLSPARSVASTTSSISL